MNNDNLSCAGCGIALIEGQDVHGLTRGSVDSDLGLRIEDDSEWDCFCSDCMNKIDQFLSAYRKSQSL